MVQELFSLFAVFIAMFLFGMMIMRTGLENLSKNKLEKWLASLTATPLLALLTGTVVTAILQSSSAVTVMTVGLVAARYISFYQSIGIILGANIGTCITLEIIAFKIEAIIIPLFILSLLLLIIPKRISFCLGIISFGLACIFTAMQGLERLAEPLTSFSLSDSFFNMANESTFIGIIAGMMISLIIQSSTATTAIAMGFVSEGSLSLTASIAIMLGSNIGTCFTAYLAAIGTRKETKLVAYAHIWLNVIGVTLIFPFITNLAQLSAMLAESAALQVAHASLIFNVVTSLLMLPFVKPFSRFIMYIHDR
ncbi:MAG TPA: Na/Pi cotransporter family protein [Bacilli bacterium]|nr:Na/Pi cotransporter family protein [Bacilli bacterium]